MEKPNLSGADPLYSRWVLDKDSNVLRDTSTGKVYRPDQFQFVDYEFCSGYKNKNSPNWINDWQVRVE